MSYIKKKQIARCLKLSYYFVNHAVPFDKYSVLYINLRLLTQKTDKYTTARTV